MSSSAVWDVSSNWEDDAAAPWYDTENDEVEEGVCSSPEEAGDMFVEQLLKLKFRGTLSARRIDDFTLFKVESERTCDVRVPGHDGLENDRVVTEVPAVPPHESIEEELAASVAAADTLATMCREQELLQAYFQHPLVRSSAPGTTRPLAIYVDGTPFSKLDSILGIFVVGIVTSSGHLVGTLQKTGICTCSSFCVTEFVKWSCLAMTSGMWPTASHHGKLWRGDSDAARSQLARTSLGFICIVLRITRNWAEYSPTLGFTTYTTRIHQRFACHCEHADMHQTSGFRPGHLSWAVNDHDSYETACRRRERWITLQGAAQHANVIEHLAWRKQNSGPRGRALDADIPASGMKKHDRLEPWIGEEFDQLQPTAARPVRVCFWRRSEETATRRLSPLLDTGLHTSVNTLTIDILHTWFLGIHRRFHGWVLWRMLEGNMFQLRASFDCAPCSLSLFYRLYHEENPAEEFSTLGDLSEKTLGQRSGSQSLRCKGAETRMLVPFSIWLFKKAPWSRAARGHHADGSGGTRGHGQHSARCTDEHEQCRDADGP